jgi:hypothetical protein
MEVRFKTVLVNDLPVMGDPMVSHKSNDTYGNSGAATVRFPSCG